MRSTSTSFAPIRARPRVGSSAPTRRCKTAWSRNCGWRVRQPWRKAMLSSLRSSPTTTRALPKRRPTTRICTGQPLRAGDDLDVTFPWKEERTLSQALTLQYDKVVFILEPSEQAKAAIGKRVTVFDYPDDRLSVRHKGIELAYRTF